MGERTREQKNLYMRQWRKHRRYKLNLDPSHHARVAINKRWEKKHRHKRQMNKRLKHIQQERERKMKESTPVYAAAHAKIFEIQQALEVFRLNPTRETYSAIHTTTQEFIESLRLVLHYEYQDLLAPATMTKKEEK